jgi:hypothetical protein
MEVAVLAGEVHHRGPDCLHDRTTTAVTTVVTGVTMPATVLDVVGAGTLKIIYIAFSYEQLLCAYVNFWYMESLVYLDYD